MRAFQQITLSSGGDILIGSPRFFALIQATPANAINIGVGKPYGVAATGSEVGKVYVAAGELSLDAPGKVVQQNSSGSAAGYAGLYLLNGVSTAKTALSIDPPSVVDLFGSYVNAGGVLTSGAEASRGKRPSTARPGGGGSHPRRLPVQRLRHLGRRRLRLRRRTSRSRRSNCWRRSSPASPPPPRTHRR